MGALIFINCIIYELWIPIRIVQHHLNKTTMTISSIFAYLVQRSRQLLYLPSTARLACNKLLTFESCSLKGFWKKSIFVWSLIMFVWMRVDRIISNLTTIVGHNATLEGKEIATWMVKWKVYVFFFLVFRLESHDDYDSMFTNISVIS
jgi:hypothetical protein